MSVSLYGSGQTVIQVVQGTYQTQFSSSSTSYVDITGFNASITPQSTTSKILVLYRINGSGGSSPQQLNFQITRNGSAVGNGSNAGYEPCHSAVRGQFSDGNPLWTTAGIYLDSPSSTSSLTYQMQLRVDQSTGYINRDPTNTANTNYASPLCTITLMEISGS